ncbi:MAG: helix-turn-helix domain-containing protein [Bacteroidales bacterium]|nr:helix-turn-helix domain-containing protein [Bacteroidales bacterium]
MNNEDFITFEAACQYLGITTGQMYQYTHKRVIPAYKPFGKKLYFLKSELNKIIGSARIVPQSEIEEQARQITRKPAAV